MTLSFESASFVLFWALRYLFKLPGDVQVEHQNYMESLFPRFLLYWNINLIIENDEIVILHLANWKYVNKVNVDGVQCYILEQFNKEKHLHRCYVHWFNFYYPLLQMHHQLHHQNHFPNLHLHLSSRDRRLHLTHTLCHYSLNLLLRSNKRNIIKES